MNKNSDNFRLVADMQLVENRTLSPSYGLLTLRADSPLPEMLPGQFVQVRIDGSQSTFLRRPISINEADADAGTLRLLVRRAGDGTAALLSRRVGDVVNVLLPLGRGFSMPAKGYAGSLLLVGGGVGVAPLMMLGRRLKEQGFAPEFLIGARSKSELLLIDEFEKIGPVYITTDDGTAGEHGVVTAHTRWQRPVGQIYCCGPAPMMKAVAKVAAHIGAACEVSLENMMACGLGACLCCVEKTVRGNVCVCTEGPVFNINELTWLD
jgi:dihydroorotate dehydrogenase electron transfer subunit